MAKKRVCRDVVIDSERSEIRLEGAWFPFHIAEAPTVEVLEEFPGLSIVTLQIYTDAVYINPRGAAADVGVRISASDMEWIHATLHNIKEETLSETLAWLRANGKDA